MLHIQLQKTEKDDIHLLSEQTIHKFVVCDLVLSRISFLKEI